MGFSVSLRAILGHRRMATSKEMTAGPALPLILKFTLPLLLGNLLQQTYSLVDAAIVGKFLGINALASVGASTSVVFLILGFCNGCCGGFGIPVAQKFGARDYSTMRSYISVSLKLSVVMSVTIAIVTSILCADILQMMRTPENIFEGAYAYLLVTFIGVPFTFFYNLLSSIIRALGDSKTPFWFLLLSTVLNIVLDLFCILVLGWGVAGAAIATVISQGLSAVLCYIYMYRKFDILQSTPKERRFQSKLAKTLLYIGVPMGLQFSITAIGSIMLQSANNALGTACVAAFTSAMRIKMFFICTFESLGIAMATYSGQNYGAGKPERIWLGIKASVLMMIIYAAFTFVLLMSGAKYFARPLGNGDFTGYGTFPSYFLYVLPCAWIVVCLALYHSRSGFYESCYVFRSGGDDCPYSRQPLCGSCFRFSGCLLRRPVGLDSCGLVPCSCFYLCLQEVEEAGAYKRFGYASSGIGVAGLRNRREVSLVSDIAGCRFRLLQSILLRLHWRMLRSFRQ